MYGIFQKISIKQNVQSNIFETYQFIQGPLNKWTEHSQDFHLLKIHSRGAPITPWGWMGFDFLDHKLL